MARRTPRPRGWLHGLAFTGAANALMAAAWWFTAARDAVPEDRVVAAPAGASPVAMPSPSPATSLAPRALPTAASPARRADPLSGALNLKQVFDDNIGSAELRLRRAAASAFAACMPAFMPTAGETPSPEALIGLLPPERRAEREAAYRSLYARCDAFLGQGRDALTDLQRRIQLDRDLREPGALALDELLAGRVEQAEARIAEALASADPAAVASLAGLAGRLAQRRATDLPDAAALLHARAVDAALPLVACDLGLDCSIDALGALQLCAVEGWCEGDLATRLLNRAAADGIDRAAIDAQRARLRALFSSGKAPSPADLLPP